MTIKLFISMGWKGINDLTRTTAHYQAKQTGKNRYCFRDARISASAP